MRNACILLVTLSACVSPRREMAFDQAGRDSATSEVEPAVRGYAAALGPADKGEQVGEISGGRGTMIVEDGNVSSVEVSEGVKVSFVKFEILAEDVFYDREAKIVTTHGPASLRSDEFEIYGTGMTVDLGGQILRVPDGVRLRVFRTGPRHAPREAR